MKYNKLLLVIKYAALAGNILFILWILYNGISEGFKGTPAEIVSSIGLIVLLSINSIFIIRGREKD